MASNTAAHLVELGVATLHEASGRRCLVEGVELLVGAPFAGPAITVALPAGDNLGVHLALEHAPPRSVVCVASAGRGLYGVVGDLLVEAARARGVSGLVIDDGVRDLAELAPPPNIAARGVSARGTIKRRLRQAVGASVSIGGTLARPGDWLVCDGDGVCVLAADELNDVIAQADGRRAKEARFRRELEAGVLSREVFSLPANFAASLD